MHTVERAVTLKEKMKSAMLVILEDEGHVMVSASVGTATSFMQPQSRIQPSLQGKEALSYDRANQAFDEISAAYRKESNRQRLDAVIESSKFSDEEKEKELHLVCVQVQRPILSKYALPCPAVVDNKADQSWLSFNLWTGSPRSSLEKTDLLVDLTSRRLAALETQIVAERKNAYAKRLADVNSKSRAQLYDQQQNRLSAAMKTSGPDENVDFIRRMLLQTTPEQLEKIGLKRVGDSVETGKNADAGYEAGYTGPSMKPQAPWTVS